MKVFKSFLLFLIVIPVFHGCYSFKGVSIPAEVSTYWVDAFQTTAPSAPGAVGDQFTQQLILKINRETRLNYTESGSDIEISGTVSSYTVRAVAPQQGNTTAFNRLEIAVNVDFVNNTDEEENWTQRFSFYRDFDNTVDLGSVEDDFIEEIFEQVTEDIFNRAFTNW